MIEFSYLSSFASVIADGQSDKIFTYYIWFAWRAIACHLFLYRHLSSVASVNH